MTDVEGQEAEGGEWGGEGAGPHLGSTIASPKGSPGP
eukprot:COSAG01_NODE_964_length_12401_cov_4.078930_2_plen_37_part_00